MWVAIAEAAAEAGIKLQPLFLLGGYQESRQRGAAVQLAIKKHLANCLDSRARITLWSAKGIAGSTWC